MKTHHYSLRHTLRALLAALAMLSLCACSDSTPAPSADGSTPGAEAGATTDQGGGADAGDAAPGLDAPQNTNGLPVGTPTLFVNLGDSIAAGSGAPKGQGYAPLLFKNNDTAYPEYAGKDLSTRFAGIQIADHAKGGAQSKDLPGQLAQVPSNPSGDTFVVVSIGGNDLQANLPALFNSDATRNIAEQVKTNFQAVLDHFADKAKYGGKVVIVWFTVYDPSDSEGNIPSDKQVSGSCILLKTLGNQAMSDNLDRFNKELGNLARANANLYQLDVHGAFLGHGFHYDDTAAKHYNASDPTLWFANDCIHPNPRGHHELRRLIWEQLPAK
ncbi:MAG: SGNH/GDSL hydrolase family protein [Myxococcales bacterium]|nr:SGNH/GDSL hydrolase family protein [Myxococcales bacterium]